MSNSKTLENCIYDVLLIKNYTLNLLLLYYYLNLQFVTSAIFFNNDINIIRLIKVLFYYYYIK